MIFARKIDLDEVAWPISRLGEAIEILARKSGFLVRANGHSPLPDVSFPPKNLNQANDIILGEWIELTANRLGIEAESVQSSYSEVEEFVRTAGPAIIRLPKKDETESAHFLMLMRGGWWRVGVITPDLNVRHVKPEIIRDKLCYVHEIALMPQINRLISEAEIAEHRRPQVQQSILHEQLRGVQIGSCWLLRLSPQANILHQIREAGLPIYFFLMTAGRFAQQLLRLAAWWVIGRGALLGHFDWAWLFAWALILITTLPSEFTVSWFEGNFFVGLGRIFKQRLLHGVLKLKPEDVRHQGAGQFLGRVMEAEAFEVFALTGGFIASLAIVELFIAGAVLLMGAGHWLHVMLLICWLVVAILMGWQYFIRDRDWIDTYREMTNDLVERMVGHRTRLAQEDQQHIHDEEDQILAHYIELSEQLDAVGVKLFTFISRGWLLLGLTGVVYTFIVNPTSSTKLAISLGGIMLAFDALKHLIQGILSVIGGFIAWEQIEPLFTAAMDSQDDEQLGVVLSSTIDKERQNLSSDKTASENTTETEEALLVVHDLFFRYREYGQPVLNGCNLRIAHGERILLEGPSGGGKSTLASVLTGLRSPESGLLLLCGFDRQTIGQNEWRRRIVSAPQFHENHVLTETFAFNLLMGRHWPPSPEDLNEAETVCRELGLEELLDRMPSGILQMVGESGWRLSHGEQSRLYIARAILQKADLIILDESFAALDPENLKKALNCVFKQAKTLLVIAHP